jgi:hypothetical protein
MSLTMSFKQAVRLAVHNENSDRSINPGRWAETYRVSVEDVRKEFELAQSEASLAPSNTYEAQDD